ncbi:type ISP restriction/modification enzyme [Ignavibacterium sp.]|jgi:predicted helicase|uniref:type ISP restriction/modification enzyme n=1 Tax=Ignavibacterium sp. TaxID=2651167 RepID=UPI0025BADF98|nr:type ISP restriction/modification enzyme [Ignavibacterium sp.]
MGYRTDFEVLLQGIFEKINVRRIDHDPKAKYGNKPDFIVMKDDIPILYIEAKTIGESLDKIEKSKQMERYFGYANLVLTDYVEFRFYRNGIKYQEPIKIAEYDLDSRTLNPIPDNFEFLGKTLIDFTQSHKEPIKSGEHLAKIMGGKARRIRDNIKEVLAKKDERKPEILNVYNTIKKLLVHDLKEEEFADMYAQTLVYGLFVARYHDKTPENFSRQEARDLVPASNPFLRHFFDHIVGPDFDKRLEFIINELCEVFAHADVQQLMKQYFQDDLWGSTNEGPDPVIHFYEDFLKEYDAELRKKMGAYYTPLPVVRFIVRSVDYLLQKEFNLPAGLADTSKLENGIHRVQILDPAVGTGTFLSAVIREIYLKFKENGQLGRWTTYVHNDLLPRLHGFELMMAPYTIAHLKLSMAFKQTGFKYFNRRLGIYLTNSLEESGPREDLFTGFGFAESIAEESKEAAIIKNETPIMVVIGNPPYSVSSSNKGKWITDLIKDYKKDLNERNIQPLSDDYIKFIRYAERFIEKNKTGIVAMITNNSFLDGIIHRQMRKHLLETFDEIYILDLHGSTKKKETAPDGSKDENVFDIQQGVAISIMIRKSVNKEKLGVVKFSEFFGRRNHKFEKLEKSNLHNVNWQELISIEPNYFFTKKVFLEKNKYQNGIDLNKLFIFKSVGVVTSNDSVLLAENEIELRNKILSNLPNELFDSKLITNYLYRPFDIKKIYYKTSLIGRAREDLMQNFSTANIGLIISKQFGSHKHFICFITNSINDKSSQPFAPYFNHPLYLVLKDGTKTSNLKKEIVEEIEKTVGKVTPEDILDYIYAVLHSPSYREKYKEFLKIDFPRVPYPKDKDIFKKLVALGTELRLLHLLELPKVDQFITTYPVDGNNEVEKVKFIPIQTSEVSKTSEVLITGNVWINKEQYFGNVPEIAWNFYIGGYQPAQKWLKDRKGRKLTNSDIEHYQKIIVALVETDRIMKEIDTIVNW